MDNITVDYLTKDELIRHFEQYKALARGAWQMAKEYRDSGKMYNKHVTMESFYLMTHYSCIFTNKDIAKTLNDLGMPEYLEEIESDEYNRMTTE